MPRTYAEIKKLKESDPEFAERLRGYAKAYVARNPEKERERQRLCKAKKRLENREANNAYMREWTAKNRDRLNKESRERRKNDPVWAEKQRGIDRKRRSGLPLKSERLKYVYKISLDIFNAMKESQNYCCVICGRHEDVVGKHKLVVDHCHESKKVRGLLCSNCNTALGQFKDDVRLLQNAIDYLTKHH